MECIIPGANLKVISKAIQALSRIGDELCFQAKPEHLALTSINMSRTALVTFSFLDVFFTSYSVKGCDTQTETCTCKMSMRTVAGIFRGNKEKKIEFCKIECETGGSTITIKMKYRQEVTMVHTIRLMDCNHPSVTLRENEWTNQLTAPSSLYNQILVMFQHNDEDISWDVTKTKATARNYNEGMQSSLKTIRTQVALNSAEFATYKVRENTEITFSLRPFRAAIGFADALNLNVTVNFSEPGKPAVLVMKTATFEVNFLLATLNSEGVSQSAVSTGVAVGSDRALAEVEEEKRAAESMNWEDDFEEGDGDVERVIPASPESPRTKRVKLVFGRCYEPTFHQSMLDLGEELVGNSDVDSE